MNVPRYGAHPAVFPEALQAGDRAEATICTMALRF